jgi:AP-1 complex subunit mu
MAVTNAVSWRTEGIRYRKNEVFLDVIESVNMLVRLLLSPSPYRTLILPLSSTLSTQVNANGNVVRSEILGAVKMKCYLSGMPELRLGLNDKVMFESTGRTSRGKSIEMEDVKFHQCVRLSRFENDRTISFIPPDGEFELMSYRLSTPVKPLVWVEAAVESHKGSRVEYMVKVKAQFKRRSTANNVEIYVPVPDDADSPKFRVCPTYLRSTVVGELTVRTGIDRNSAIRTRQICIRLENETTWRIPRIPHARTFWSSKRQTGCVFFPIFLFFSRSH